MSKVDISWKVPRTYNPEVIESLFKSVADQLALLSEGKQGAYYGARTSAPTSGKWARGDWVKNSEPSAAGYFGWVCVASGEPGTWKGFGVIQS